MQDDIIDKVVNKINESKNITVFTGAGISTNCGIPDFRSENGLYNMVKKKYDLPYPEAIFDINYFLKDPKPFFDLSKGLFGNNIEPSISHKFIAWLESINKISLVMTQNIDMLHSKAGNKKVIECHGTYKSAHCIRCDKIYELQDIENDLKNGNVPECSCGSIIKPDIVFFGEQLPKEFYKVYESPPATDLLLVMGTSLMVQPAAGFALKLSQSFPSILVNLEPTYYDDSFTYVINEDLDKFSKQVWNKLEELSINK